MKKLFILFWLVIVKKSCHYILVITISKVKGVQTPKSRICILCHVCAAIFLNLSVSSKQKKKDFSRLVLEESKKVGYVWFFMTNIGWGIIDQNSQKNVKVVYMGIVSYLMYTQGHYC